MGNLQGEWRPGALPTHHSHSVARGCRIIPSPEVPQDTLTVLVADTEVVGDGVTGSRYLQHKELLVVIQDAGQ